MKYKSKKERSRSRDLEKSDPLKYPPINQDQFRAVVIDYLMSDQFDYPISGNELYQCINSVFLVFSLFKNYNRVSKTLLI